MALWKRPDTIDSTLAKISAAVDAGAERLMVVRPYRADEPALDLGELPYGRIDILLTRLRGRYRLLEVRDYPGRIEAASAYQFDLRHHPAPGPSGP